RTQRGLDPGKPSTGMERLRYRPKYISASAMATTRKRNFKLDPTIQRIIAVDLSGLSFSAVFGTEQLRRSDRHDRRTGGRTVRQHDTVPIDVVDRDGMSDEHPRLGAGVD